jgi:hypothetical protein
MGTVRALSPLNRARCGMPVNLSGRLSCDVSLGTRETRIAQGLVIEFWFALYQPHPIPDLPRHGQAAESAGGRYVVVHLEVRATVAVQP